MPDKTQQFNPDQLRADAEDAIGEAVAQFSNNAVVTMTNDHMVLEFQFAFTPTGGRTVNKMLSRLVMTPSHAKRYFKTLARNIKAYEDAFGPIPDYVTPKPASGVAPAGKDGDEAAAQAAADDKPVARPADDDSRPGS